MRAPVIVALAALAVLFILSFSGGWMGDALSLEGREASLSDRFLPPSFSHILGTDELGRDVFIRLLEGGRVSLSIALAATLISALIGTAAGVSAGYFGGMTDAALMRFADFLIALPALPLLIVLSAVDVTKLGLENTDTTGVFRIVLLVSFFGWTTVARLARARTLSIRSADYVRAARALGAGHGRIILSHVFPNLAGTVAVAAALSVGNIILTESVLSFLGLGIQPPAASWGSMLANAGENIWEHTGLALYPGFMIFVTVLAFNVLGDGLRRQA